MAKPELLNIMLLVNDDRNGHATGYVEAMHIYGASDNLLELDGPGHRISWPRGNGIWTEFVRLGRRKFPIWSYQQWVGNWCWDQICVVPITAAGIVNLALQWGWDCHCGESVLFEQYERKEHITAEHLLAAEARLINGN